MSSAVFVRSQQRFRQVVLVAAVLAAAAMLAGCQNKASISGSDPLTTSSLGSPGQGVSFKKTEEL